MHADSGAFDDGMARTHARTADNLAVAGRNHTRTLGSAFKACNGFEPRVTDNNCVSLVFLRGSSMEGLVHSEAVVVARKFFQLSLQVSPDPGEESVQSSATHGPGKKPTPSRQHLRIGRRPCLVSAESECPERTQVSPAVPAESTLATDREVRIPDINFGIFWNIGLE